MTVYKDIKSRNIGWPEPEKIDQLMSKEAFDLINRMIQLEPSQRLGYNLESLKLMKTHPFFEGIDFTEISSPDYKGLLQHMQKILPEVEEMKKEAEKRISVMNVGALDLNELGIENIVVIKGQLCKRNWYGNKQIRFFELYKSGEMKYYKDMKEYKGSIILNSESKISKVAKTTIKVYCVKKEKEYMLIQPDSS